MGAATVGGAALRLATASFFSLWGDELATLKWALLPVADLLGTFGEGATSHFYLLFMKGWIALLGASPLVVRLPSLIAGVALVPLVWICGRRWLDARTATVAALMAAMSKPLILYSRLARPYAILTVLGLVSAWLLLEALRTGSRRSLLCLAVLDAVMVWTTLNALCIVGVQVLVVGLEAIRRPSLPRRRLLALAASFALAGLLSLAFYSQILGAVLETQRTSAARHLRPSLLLETFVHNHPSSPWLMLAAMALGAWLAWRRGQPAGRLLVLWATLPHFLYVLSKTSYPVPGIARYLVPGVPAQLLLVGLGLTTLAGWLARRLGPRWSLAAALALALVAMFWQRPLWDPAAHGSLFKEQRPTAPALQRVRELARPGDIVTFDLETRFAWLFAFERELESSSTRALVHHPDLERPGRLIVLTNDRPLARPWWSEHFELEVIGGPRFREQLLLLVSDTVPAGEGALREPLRDYLQGYVETSEGDPAWSRWKTSRQQLVLSWAHRLLARLATDSEARAAHSRQAQSYAELWKETLRSIGEAG